VFAKFFDCMGPIPHHMHQSHEHAKLVGREGKPEAYYFPPHHNTVGNNFPYTFMGLEPGTTKEQVKQCLENWNKGDNGILALSKAYRLKPGSGWLIGPGILHAPGSFCTYEPQWSSDVLSMFQSLVEGREIPRSLLVKDIPPIGTLILIILSASWIGTQTSIPPLRRIITLNLSHSRIHQKKRMWIDGSCTAKSTGNSLSPQKS
jgi:hypothetical protein